MTEIRQMLKSGECHELVRGCDAQRLKIRRSRGIVRNPAFVDIVDTYDRQRLGRLVRRLRTDAGHNFEIAAKLLRCSVPVLSRVESGMQYVNAEVLQRIAQLYGVSVDWLCGTEGR